MTYQLYSMKLIGRCKAAIQFHLSVADSSAIMRLW